MNFEKYLEKNGELIYNNKGVSMQPMLKQGRDLMVIKKKGSERCKKYDVALYVSPNHKYVLHRIIKVNENDYVFLGDNCVNKEYGIKDSDIIGVLSEFVRKGKRVKVTNRGYILYSRFWYFIYPLRKLLKTVKYIAKGKLKALKRKIKE